MANFVEMIASVDTRGVKRGKEHFDQFTDSTRRAARGAGRYQDSMKRATAQTARFNTVGQSTRRLLTLLSTGFAGIGAAQLAQGIGQATMELNRIRSSLMVATQDSYEAGRALDFVRQESERLGLYLPSVAKQFAQLAAASRASALDIDDIQRIFTGVAEATTALGLTAPEAAGALRALQQMISKGRIAAEELRGQLGERLPGALLIMAEALGVTAPELNKMLEDGELLAEEVLPKFADQMEKTFSPQATRQAQKLQAEINRLRTALFEAMADEDGLPGAVAAIRELTDAVSSSQFQSGVDKLITFFSDSMTYAIENSDTLIRVAQALAAIGVVRFAVRNPAATAIVGAATLSPMLDEAGTTRLEDLEERLIPSTTRALEEYQARLESLDEDSAFDTVKIKLYNSIIQNLTKSLEDYKAELQDIRSGGGGGATFTEGVRQIEAGPGTVTHVDLIAQAEEELRKYRRVLYLVNKQSEEAEPIYGRWEQSLRDVGSVIKDDVVEGLTDVIMQAESAEEVFSSLLDTIARAVLQQQVINPFVDQIAGISLGSIFGGGAGSTSIGGGAPPNVRGIGPARANGGNVYGNTAHLVGERGPELFVPRQDGSIVPNNRMSGGGDVTVNIINEGGERLETQGQQQRRGPNGEMTVDVMVKSSMERLDAQGQLDGIFRRHGARRQGQF